MRWLARAWTGIVWLAWSQAAWACPFCSEGLFDPAQAQATSKMAFGYSVSIALLILTPLAMVVGLACWIIRSARRAQQSQAPDPTA